MINIEELFEYLPHRFPMLLVDRILEVDHEARTCRGLKNVTINEPFFQGHYPGHPIMPGVLILESMAQVGAALLLASPDFRGRIPLIGNIDDVKFRRQVIPGDQLIIDCEILRVRKELGVGRMKAVASVEGDLVASMEITFKLKEREE